MKKVLSIVAVAVMTLGFVSCEAESMADQEELFINAGDGEVTESARN
ncbi:hypothetical protein [Croceitalea rosinachiae]|uniref:Uncharacterized protein n=1 Tax=Croceitalea rosinachiae TaxID=3075596 RepID=A0ABU3ABE5_9FLAO|nr:hypothetical protein [Croceitalea sp. F388]MDT0607304.1 hypothetical protein [Croceitalea sp. F388]